MERETGLEPATSSLGSWHSTTELLPPCVGFYLTTRQELNRCRTKFKPSIPYSRTRADRKMDGKVESDTLLKPGLGT